MALPRGAVGLSAVCDCGISCSYSLTIFGLVNVYQDGHQTSYPVLTAGHFVRHFNGL